MIDQQPSEALTPEVLDTAPVVFVAAAGGEVFLWVGDHVTAEQAAVLFRGAADQIIAAADPATE